LLNVISHQGPVTRTVADAAAMLSVIGQPDARDMAAWTTPKTDYTAGLEDGVRGLRIAYSPRLGAVNNLDRDIEVGIQRAARALEDEGAVVEETDPPLERALELIQAMWWPVATAIVDSVPAPRRGDMDPGFLRIAERGRAFSTGDYLAAYAARSALYNAMRGFHERYDLLLTPTMPGSAADADHAGDRIEGRAGNAGGRRFWRRLAQLVALHLSVQPDAAAGNFGALRACRRRPADGRAAGWQDGRGRACAAGCADARTGLADAAAGGYEVN